MGRKRQPPKPVAVPASCPACDNLRAKARAIQAAEMRRDAADPLCACHNYRRSSCIAPSTEAWWTRERIDEYHAAKEWFDRASAEFDAAMEALRESVR